MPYKIIVLNQEIANYVGIKEKIVPVNPVDGSMVSVGSFKSHLSNFLIETV